MESIQSQLLSRADRFRAQAAGADANRTKVRTAFNTAVARVNTVARRIPGDSENLARARADWRKDFGEAMVSIPVHRRNVSEESFQDTLEKAQEAATVLFLDAEIGNAVLEQIDEAEKKMRGWDANQAASRPGAGDDEGSEGEGGLKVPIGPQSVLSSDAQSVASSGKVSTRTIRVQ